MSSESKNAHNSPRASRKVALVAAMKPWFSWRNARMRPGCLARYSAITSGVSSVEPSSTITISRRSAG